MTIAPAIRSGLHNAFGTGSLGNPGQPLSPALTGDAPASFSRLLDGPADEQDEELSARAFDALGMFGRADAVAFRSSAPFHAGQPISSDSSRPTASAPVDAVGTAAVSPTGEAGPTIGPIDARRSSPMSNEAPPAAQPGSPAASPAIGGQPFPRAAPVNPAEPGAPSRASVPSIGAGAPQPPARAPASDISLTLTSADGVLRILARGLGDDEEGRDALRRQADQIASEFDCTIEDLHLDGVATPSTSYSIGAEHGPRPR